MFALISWLLSNAFPLDEPGACDTGLDTGLTVRESATTGDTAAAWDSGYDSGDTGQVATADTGICERLDTGICLP